MDSLLGATTADGELVCALSTKCI